MALLWFDGFENYDGMTGIYLLRVQNSIFSSITWSSYAFGVGYGRNGMGIRHGTGGYLIYELINNYTSFIVGAAVKRAETQTEPSYNALYPLYSFLDGADYQLRFHVVGTEVVVYNGAGSLLGTSDGAGITYNTWRFIEVKFTINNSAGSVIVKSNEDIVLTLSDVDTQYTANAYINRFKLGSFVGPSAIYADDLYMCDLTGDAPHNDFLGDVRIDVLRPSAAGTYTDFTPSAESNYQNVDEGYPDDDTTYNDGSDVGDKDSYQMPDLPSPAGTTIYGVKSQITVRKTDVGSRKCKLLTRVGTTDDLGDEIILSDSYLTHTKIFEDNPDDSAAWEDADVNAMEVGVEITA